MPTYSINFNIITINECHPHYAGNERPLQSIAPLYHALMQGRIYYEANEASASGPHHLRGPHQNFNAVSKVDFYIASKIFKS